MAGMLPGVELARRRRLHQSGDSSSTRRSSFCFHSSTNHDSHLSPSYSMIRDPSREACLDEKLGEAAREAKERLDGRLKANWKSDIKRAMVEENVQTEVVGLKKSRSKRFNWGKLRWKSSDQYECALCLDHFEAGETIMPLSCDHRFHSRCLMPWLETNAHCPSCRMEISIE